MRKATLTRIDSSDEGTFGELLADSGFKCRTGELPWRDNRSNESCIPPGTYTCTWRLSLRHGYCYHVDGVPGRTAVEIHSANFMGDKIKGFQCELLGCIAPGRAVCKMNGQKAMFSSRAALHDLEADMARASFLLTVF